MTIRLARSVIAAALAIAFQSTLAATDDEATVVVTATRTPTRTDELLADMTVLQREDIEAAGQSTLEQVLSRQAGMEYAANGSPGASSKLYVRGTEGGHVLVLIDGQRLGSATLGDVSWSRIPLSQIERIEILRGPASALYGSDAIGGVVQIFTRHGTTGLHANAEIGIGSYGTHTLGAGVAGGAGGWRYSINGSSFKTAGFNSIENPANKAFNPDRDGFSNDSMAASLSYSPLKGHEAGMTFFRSDGTNRYDNGSSPASAAKNYENALAVQAASLYLKNRFSDRWTSTMRFGSSTDDSTNYSNGTVSSATRTDQSQWSWQNDVRLPVGMLVLGWENLKQQISGTTAYSSKERDIRSLLAGWTGTFDAHRLQANIRHDDNSQFGAHDTGALAYGYQITAAWRLSASYGSAFRAPSFNDLYYPVTVLFGKTYAGNPALQPESARNREIALHHEAGGQHVSATLYRNDVQNLISWTGLTSPINIGRARIEGLTLAYAGSLAGYDAGASVDIVDARNAVTDARLPRRAHERLNLSLGRTQGAWEWGGEIQAAGKRYDDTANTVKLGGYAIANLRLRYALSPEWSCFGRIDNLFGKRYELISDYATPGVSVFIGLRYAPK